MNKLLVTIVFVAVGFVAKGQSAAEKQVLAAVKELKSALTSGNKLELEHIAGDDLSYGHSNGKIQDKAAFVEAIVSGKSDFVSINLDNQTIKVTGKTALVRHDLNAKTNDNGVPGEIHLGVLLVFQKEGKNWKLLGRQSFKLPTP